MRFRELLLEYSLEKTVERFGAAVWNKIRNLDASGYAQNYRASVLSDARREYDVIRGNSIVDPADYSTIVARHAVQGIENFDPTPNKEYMRWLCQRYVDGGIRLFEDFSKARQYLERFHEAKRSGYFKRHPEHAQYADIGRFKTVSELGAFVLESLTASALTSNNEKDRARQDELVKSGAATIVYDDDTWRVVIPHTQEASCFFGRNTQWCTAATDSDNYFNSYNRDGPLYIVLNKPSNRRWQLHFDTQQFMDERDEPIERWGDLAEVFHKCRFAVKPAALAEIMRLQYSNNEFQLPPQFYAENLKPLSNEELAQIALVLSNRLNIPINNPLRREIDSRPRVAPERTQKIDVRGTRTIYDFGKNIGDLVIWLYQHNAFDGREGSYRWFEGVREFSYVTNAIIQRTEMIGFPYATRGILIQTGANLRPLVLALRDDMSWTISGDWNAHKIHFRGEAAHGLWLADDASNEVMLALREYLDEHPGPDYRTDDAQ